MRKFGNAALAALAAAWLWAAPASSPAAGGEAAPRPYMLYFYNPTCRLCTHATETVAAVEEKYAASLGRQRLNITDPATGADNVLYLFDLLDEMDVQDEGNVTLAVFLGFLTRNGAGEAVFQPQKVLIEGDNIIKNLEKAAADFLAGAARKGTAFEPEGGAAPFFSSPGALASAAPESGAGGGGGEPVLRGSRSAAEREAAAAARAQARLRWGAVSFAALADSINPCAFATIIVLVSMMSNARRTRREIAAVCLSFTAAVYLTYFAIGLFLYEVISEINQRGGWFLFFADLIYYAAFALCAVFGFLSFRDAWLILRGRPAEEMVLQLPKALKSRINVAMAKGVRASWLAAGVFIAGVTVSFFEAACTGQVYLPTIIAIAKLEFWESILILAWYNLLFILPLLVIFALVLWGVGSRQLADFFKRNVAWSKAALGAVFVAMGAVLWFEMYWPPGYRG